MAHSYREGRIEYLLRPVDLETPDRVTAYPPEFVYSCGKGRFGVEEGDENRTV